MLNNEGGWCGTYIDNGPADGRDGVDDSHDAVADGGDHALELEDRQSGARCQCHKGRRAQETTAPIFADVQEFTWNCFVVFLEVSAVCGVVLDGLFAVARFDIAVRKLMQKYSLIVCGRWKVRVCMLTSEECSGQGRKIQQTETAAPYFTVTSLANYTFVHETYLHIEVDLYRQ